MSYRQLVKKIQRNSGLSDFESEAALDTMVESLAERLPDEELENFASQLPSELQDLVLSGVLITHDAQYKDIVQEFMMKEQISYERAKKQVLSAWLALKSFISEGQIKRIKAQLSPVTAELLH